MSDEKDDLEATEKAVQAGIESAVGVALVRRLCDAADLIALRVNGPAMLIHCYAQNCEHHAAALRFQDGKQNSYCSVHRDEIDAGKKVTLKKTATVAAPSTN